MRARIVPARRPAKSADETALWASDRPTRGSGRQRRFTPGSARWHDGAVRRLAPVYREPAMPWWWDRMIIVLTVVAIGLLLTLEVAELSDGTAKQLEVVDVVLCGLFLADFLIRLRMARDDRLRFTCECIV